MIKISIEDNGTRTDYIISEDFKFGVINEIATIAHDPINQLKLMEEKNENKR